MADTRTTSVLDIRVNMRSLGGLGKKLKEVFSGKQTREFNSGLTQVNRSLQENVKHTLKIAEALGKVEKGSKAYKRLRDQLRSANTEGKALRQTLDGLDRTYQRMKRSAGSGGVAGGGGGGGAGMGGMAGGAMSRARGAQVPMPGMGAITTALGAIPIAGLAAAGSLMAASQTYQSRLRFEQARMDAAPFLMHSSAAGQFRPTSRMVSMAGKSAIGAGGVLQPQVAGTLINEMGTNAARAVGPTGLTELELATATQERRQAALVGMFGSAVGSRLGSNPTIAGLQELTGLGALNRNATEKSILAEQASLRSRTGPSLAEVLGTPEEAAEARRSRAEALASGGRWTGAGAQRQAGIRSGTQGPVQRRVSNGAFDSQSFVEAGRQMGLAPAQALQMASQMAQAAGTPINAEQFGQGMALQRTMGVSLGQTGGAMKGLRYAGELSGQGGGSMEQVANMIGDAVALGLEGSEIGTYLQEQTGFLNQMATQGIGVDIEKMRALEGSIAGSGISAPWRAEAISRQFATGAANIGRNGAQSAEQFRLMKAFGMSGEGGLEEFFQTRMGMQSSVLAEKYGMNSPQKAMSQFIEQFRMTGVGEATQAGVLQKAFSGIGTQIGPEEAMALSRGLQSATPGGYEIDVDAAKRLVGSTAGNVRAEAGIEGERVATGARAAKAMQALERTTNNMAEIFENTLGPVVERFAENLEGITSRLDAATAGGLGTLDPLGMRISP